MAVVTQRVARKAIEKVIASNQVAVVANNSARIAKIRYKPEKNQSRGIHIRSFAFCCSIEIIF